MQDAAGSLRLVRCLASEETESRILFIRIAETADARGWGGGVAEEQGNPLELGAPGPATSTPIFFRKVLTVPWPALIQLRALALELKLNTTFRQDA